VYNPEKRGARKHAQKLVRDGRTSLIAAADYQDGEAIDQAVKAVVDKIEASSRIA
jgi:hypothetical protein